MADSKTTTTQKDGTAITTDNADSRNGEVAKNTPSGKQQDTVAAANKADANVGGDHEPVTRGLQDDPIQHQKDLGIPANEEAQKHVDETPPTAAEEPLVEPNGSGVAEADYPAKDSETGRVVDETNKTS